ncbi:hypothetical protein ACHAXA_002678 [Cyclostephanos tholiformis]|uniref:Uncharacterized protein n=1 Tax=Cyclostephanos tholiformis TaxID=382380 RepID=A0ABD3S056_9STRA
MTERGMRRLEEEGDKARRERAVRRGEERRRRRRRRGGGGIGGVGIGVEDENRVDADHDRTPPFSDDEYAYDPFLPSRSDDDGKLDDNNNDYDCYYDDDDDDDDDDDESLERELQLSRLQKTHSALLSAHQLEALWKITKIELDRTIREACRRILMGHYGGWQEGGRVWNAFCHPSERMTGGGDRSLHRRCHPYSSSPPPPPPPPPPQSPSLSGHSGHQFERHRPDHMPGRKIHGRPRGYDGWVGTTGEVVTMEVGRMRSAAALILLGDLFVRCSKDGTAWNKR